MLGVLFKLIKVVDLTVNDIINFLNELECYKKELRQIINLTDADTSILEDILEIMIQVINGIKISKIIKDDIKRLSLKEPTFTLYELFELLQRYFTAKDIQQLLDIGKTSYYSYYKNKKLKYVEQKLYNFYLSLEF